MKTINSFSLSKLTDDDLSRLAAECFAEQERRESKCKKERQKCYYHAFLRHPNASVVCVGETTVIAILNRNFEIKMGTATPVHGDVFDHDTGIAVAYAKAIGNKIPDYI